MPLYDPKEVGARIRQRRLDLGLTQEQVAKRLHVGQRYISKIEAGDFKSFGYTLLLDFAKVLETSAEYLGSGSDPDEDNDLSPTEAEQGANHVAASVS